jgi:hypothetical protein
VIYLLHRDVSEHVKIKDLRVADGERALQVDDQALFLLLVFDTKGSFVMGAYAEGKSALSSDVFYGVFLQF